MVQETKRRQSMPPITKGDIHPYHYKGAKMAKKKLHLSTVDENIQSPLPTHQLFSVRDSKGNFFNIPFSKMNEAVAHRDFKNMTNDPNSPVFKNPEDYDLYLIASYCEKTGKVYPLDTPRHIAKAVQLKD